MTRDPLTPPSQPNQSLINGMACFQLVASHGVPLGSREIARRLRLEHTRVNRLLGTLAYLGLVSKTEDRKYAPGPALHVLSAQSLHGSGLLSHSIPVLRRVRQPRMVVALGVLWRDSVCYLVHARPGQDPSDAIGAHTPYEATDSVIGHVLLAYVDPNVVPSDFTKRYGESYPESIRSSGIVSFRKPNRELSVAAAVFSPDSTIGPVAAIALTGPCREADEERVVNLLREGAQQISERLARGIDVHE